MLDLLIRGAHVVDGTGASAVRADVGVKHGRIVIDPHEDAARVIEGDGLVLAPGFIDVHTHYDAQVSWDPAVSPSPLHGVTTVFGGNCGFTLAPFRPEDVDYLNRLMARVEGMPLAALEGGLKWDWNNYADWLDRLEGNLGVNAGFMVGHTAIRRAVMGEAARDKASEDQVAEMVRLLHEGLQAGGLGFSTSLAPAQHDGDGHSVPSNFAEPSEILTMAAAVRDHPGTAVGLVPSGTAYGLFRDDEVELMTDISLAADRPVNWNVLRVSAERPELYKGQLAASDRAARRGGRLLALTIPHPQYMRQSFDGTGFLDVLPGWGDVLHLPHDERRRALGDPAVRKRLADGAASEKTGIHHATAQWHRAVVAEVFSPENAALLGRTIGDIAAERGGDPFDVLLDVVLADDLRTGIEPEYGRTTPEENEMRAEVWRDERTIVGGSDAGAHLDMMCGAIFTTSLLGEGVREFGVISMEEAVRQLTDVPARIFGLRDRGRIADGWWADLVLFDPQQIGWQQATTRSDLPGGASRLYSEATGIEGVWVNGVEIVRQGELTGSLGGTLIRSGRDTDTVTVPGNH